jgi:hypothetical protein
MRKNKGFAVKKYCSFQCFRKGKVYSEIPPVYLIDGNIVSASSFIGCMK